MGAALLFADASLFGAREMGDLYELLRKIVEFTFVQIWALRRSISDPMAEFRPPHRLDSSGFTIHRCETGLCLEARLLG